MGSARVGVAQSLGRGGREKREMKEREMERIRRRERRGRGWENLVQQAIQFNYYF